LAVGCGGKSDRQGGPATGSEDMMGGSHGTGAISATGGLLNPPAIGGGSAIATGAICDTSGATCSVSGDICRPVGNSAGAASRHGYCTHSCNPGDASACGDQGGCARVGGDDICLALCPTDELSHCGLGSRCREIESGVSVCYPQCTGDQDCASGACDFGSGLCSTSVSIGSFPVGAPCEDGEAGLCDMICGAPLENFESCTGLCNQGTFDTCPVCLNGVGEFQTGAAGFCFQPCDCDGECFHQDAICDPFTGREAQGRSLFGFTLGVCLPRSAVPESKGLPCQ